MCKEMYTGLLLVLFITCQAKEIKGREEITPRLSDYPVIKRWEIPIKVKNSEIGRRHKDVFAEKSIKRSFWEKKPEYNLRELEADEDPEKIYMDLHFSKNMLDDDLEIEEKTPRVVQSAGLTGQTNKGEVVMRKNSLPIRPLQNKQNSLARYKKNNETISEEKVPNNAEKKRLIALKPFLHSKTKYKKKRRRRNRRSVYDDDDSDWDHKEDEEHFQDALLDDEEDDDISARVKRSYTPTLANFHFDQYDEDEKDNEEVSREKRAISSALIKTKQHQQNNKHSLSGKSTDIKRTISSHEEVVAKIIKSKKNKGAHSKIPDNAKRFTVSSDIRQHNKQNETETERKTKAMIQKAFFTKSNNGNHDENTVRHIIPQSASKRTLPSVDVKLLSKSLLEHEIGEIPGFKTGNFNRQHIFHPSSEKSADSINTANVARAVAVAMEQLKRDKMWGKVFVHVRPRGELKVMVQETKKMEDE